MNTEIGYAFKLYLTLHNFPVMFSKLNDGNFTVSFMKNNKLEIQFITQKEYAFALAYYNLI
jgi:hypothetical protein